MQFISAADLGQSRLRRRTPALGLCFRGLVTQDLCVHGVSIIVADELLAIPSNGVPGQGLILVGWRLRSLTLSGGSDLRRPAARVCCLSAPRDPARRSECAHEPYGTREENRDTKVKYIGIDCRRRIDAAVATESGRRAAAGIFSKVEVKTTDLRH